MIKQLLLSVAVCLAVCTGAQDLPKKWNAAFCNLEEKVYRKHPVSEKLKTEFLQKTLQFSGERLDLDAAAEKKWNTVYLTGTVFSEKDQTVWFGAGGKSFGLSVNGKMVYDMMYYGLGNDFAPTTANDHIFSVPLKKGENKIEIVSRRTHYLLDYCYGKDRQIIWDLALKIHPDYQPVKAELAHPEMLLRPDQDSIMVSFMTKDSVPAAVDYREKGSKTWQREWDLLGDLVVRELDRTHRIRITDLPPGKEIEYRIVLLEPPAGMIGKKRPLWIKHYYKEILLPVKSFRIPNKNEFSFFVFGDTQLSISTTCRTVADRKKFMKKMRSLPGYQNADFIVHIGDMTSYFHDMERDLLTDLLDDFAPEKGENVRPWVMVRGNHEVNGIEAERWYDFFLMPGEKGYYSFTFGDTFFIVLDCGDYAPVEKNTAASGAMINMDHLMRKQGLWLEKIKKSEAFRKAKYRIVLSHVEPQLNDRSMDQAVRKMTESLLKDETPEGMIHLWIAGHIHKFFRGVRGSDKLFSPYTVKKPAKKIAPVNWVAVDGPKGDSSDPNFSYLSVNVTEDKIKLEVVDENGKSLDCVEIDKEGKL